MPARYVAERIPAASLHVLPGASLAPWPNERLGRQASFDGPARAIRCACAVRDALADLGLGMRAGLHTDECEQIDGKVAGIAVVTGARIAALGGAGDVFVSATVRDAGAGIAFEDRGLHQLKGLPEQSRGRCTPWYRPRG